jgi:endonuclease/exonuclease/phosphatase family metal-dependent hydrolase
VRVTVASYNIHGCVGLDRRPDHARIVRILRKLEADVIALQEVDAYHDAGTWRQHLDYFAAETGMTPVAGPTMTHERGDYGTGLLTKLPVVSTRRIEIGVAGHEPRVVLDVTVEGPTGPLRVVATHLGLRRAERAVQTAMLRELVRSAEEQPVILLGDFNEWLASAPLIRDIEGEMGPGRAPRTFPAPLPLFALDRIWVRPPDRLVEVRALWQGEARWASDHLPVRAVLEL